MLTNKIWYKLCFLNNSFFLVNRVKRQWKSLRDAYVKYQKKRQMCPSIRPYVYEKEMEFLLPQVLNTLNKPITIDDHFLSSFILREEDSISVSSYSETEPNDIQHEKMDDQQEFLEEVSFEYETQSHSSGYQNSSDLYESEDKSKEYTEEYYNNNDDRSQNDKHPIDAFFYGIAQTVKQLKPLTRTRIKKAIANVVLDAEAEEVERVEHFK